MLLNAFNKVFVTQHVEIRKYNLRFLYFQTIQTETAERIWRALYDFVWKLGVLYIHPILSFIEQFINKTNSKKTDANNKMQI